MLFFILSSGSAWATLTQTEVSQLYVSLLGRASEGDGNAYWMNATNMAEAAGSMLNCTDVKKNLERPWILIRLSLSTFI